MAAQIGALRVTVGADITGLQTGMARAQREVSRGAAGMQKSLTTVTSSFKSLAAVAGVSLGLAGLAAGARALLSIADASKSLNAQLKLATAQYGSFGQAQKDVQGIASRTRSDLLATAQLYSALQRNSDQLGITQQFVARTTETVAKSFKISGASTNEQTYATRQLIQAFQAGVLRGDEFRSIMENAPRLSRLLADSLGVTIGKLREMSLAGELTADVLVKAFDNPQLTAELDKQFEQLPVTFEQAMGQVYNAAVITFGAFDRGGQFSTALSNFITGGTQGFADLERAAYDFGATLRGLFDTLDSIKAAFGSIQTEGVGAMLGIEGATVNLRATLSTLLGVIDGVANKFANLINLPGNLIRQVTGAGGKPIVDPFNMRGVFDKTARAADLRRITGQGLDPSEWPGRTPPPFRPSSSGGGKKAGGGSKGPSAESLAAKAKREMEQRMRRDAAVDNERARNNIELLRAEQDLTNDYQQRSDLALKILDIEREQDLKAVDLAVKLGDRTEAEAEALKLQINDLDQLKQRAVLHERDLQTAREAAQLAEADLDIQQQQLQAEAALATTADEMREAQLRLLDLAFRQEKARLEATIADEESSAAAKEEARRRLAALPALAAAQRAGVLASTRGPMEDYLASLPNTAAKAQEALERLQVQGMEGLIDAALALTEGFKSAKDALLGTLKQFFLGLARMELQKGLGQLFSSGFKIPGFATGTPYAPGGWAMVGERGPEIVRLPRGSQVIPNHDLGANRLNGGRGDTYMTVVTPDADSFRRSERQITREWRRRIA